LGLDTSPVQWRLPLLGGGVALVLTNLANLNVRAVASALFRIAPTFPPLASPVSVIFLTSVAVIVASVVFAVLTRVSTQPDVTFIRTAMAVLPLTWLLPLLVASRFPGASVAAVVTLLVMHSVTAVLTVAVLIWLSRPAVGVKRS
jgi:hypothetical protein